MTEEQRHQKLVYMLGKRDAIAAVLMMVRDKGPIETITEIANQLQRSNPRNPNPHADWWLNIGEKEHKA